MNLFPSINIGSLSVLLLASCLSQADLSAQTWNQITGGTYNWDDPSNWSPATVPDAFTANVVISGGISGNQTINQANFYNYKLNSITIGATSGAFAYTVQTGQLDFSGAATPAAITQVATGQSDKLLVKGITVGLQGLTITSNPTAFDLVIGDGAARSLGGTGNLTVNGGVAFATNFTLNNVGSITFGSAGSNRRITVQGIGANVTGITINRAAAGDTVGLSGASTNFAGSITLTKGTLGVYHSNALNNSSVVIVGANTTDSIINLRQSAMVGGLNGAATINTASGATLSTITLSGSGNYIFNAGGVSMVMELRSP